jgi:hypothetical protein
MRLPVPIYYVATLARYALVEADDEESARELGKELLVQMYDDYRRLAARGIPIEIRTVRGPTETELNLWRWHLEAQGEAANDDSC